MPTIPPSLGSKVTTRDFSWLDMCMRAWGPEFTAPDHGIYVFRNGRQFDSTDRGKTGIYGVVLDNPIAGFEQNTADMFDPLQIDPSGETLQFD